MSPRRLWPSVESRGRQALAAVLTGLGRILSGAGRRLHVSEAERRTRPWFAASGDKTLRLDYDLNADSRVFDLGGHEGQWTSDIVAKYGCRVFVFEPVTQFAEQIARRFARNPRVQVFPFGLAATARRVPIYLQGDGTSLFGRSGQKIEIELRAFTDFVRQHEIEQIELIKINIEGAEYDLLEDLIKTGFIGHIRDIQVQFHDFVPHCKQRMQSIQDALSLTHTPTYCFPLVWENWRLRTEAQQQPAPIRVAGQGSPADSRPFDARER